LAIETISILDALGAQKAVLADLIGTSYGQVLKVAFGTDGTLTLAEPGIGLPVQIAGSDITVSVAQTRPSASAVTSVSASAASVQLLAINTNRKDCALYNDSTSAVRVKLGTTASATSFTAKLDAGGYYEIPYGYTGRIDAIWDSATGSMRITELT
jgi:hypothetical protein